MSAMNRSDDHIERLIQRWASQLVDLSYRNPALNSATRQTPSLVLQGGDPPQIAIEATRRHARWNVGYDPPPSTIRTTALWLREGTRAASLIEEVRRAGDGSGANAVRTWLTLGALRWEMARDQISDTAVESPLILVPVLLEPAATPGGAWLLAGIGPPRVNPVLALAVRHHLGLNLPSLGTEPHMVDEAIAAIESMADERGDWQIDQTISVQVLSIDMSSVYEELQLRESRLRSHPIMGSARNVAAKYDTAIDRFLRADPDGVLAPENEPVLVPADATRRRVLAAVKAGRSLVASAADRAARSSFSAAVAAHLTGSARTTLVLAPDAGAARDVMRHLHLAGVDDRALLLDDPFVDLDSIAGSLARPPREAAGKEPEPLPVSTVGEIGGLRATLTRYHEALHEVRQPLGRSLYQVLDAWDWEARDPNTLTAPVAGLSSERMARLEQAAELLVSQWIDPDEREGFVWKGIRSSAAHWPAEEIAEDLGRAIEILDALVAQTEADEVTQLAGKLESLPETTRLLQLLQRIELSRGFPASWLSAPDLASVREQVHELEAAAIPYKAVGDELAELAGPSWTSLDYATSTKLRTSAQNLAAAKHRIPVKRTDTYRDLVAVAGAVSAVLARLEVIAEDVTDLALLVDIDPDRVILSDVPVFAELDDLRYSADVPGPALLDSRTLRDVAQTVERMERLVEEYRSAEQAAQDIYLPEIVEADIDYLAGRLHIERGIRHRKGRKEIKDNLAEFLVDGQVSREAIARLDQAKAWQSTWNRLIDAQDRIHEALGETLFNGPDTDFHAVRRKLDVAAEALALSGGLFQPVDLARLLASEPGEGSEDQNSLYEQFEVWQQDVSDLFGEAVEPLMATPLQMLIREIGDLEQRLDHFMAAVHQFDDLLGREFTVGEQMKVAGLIQRQNQLSAAYDELTKAATKTLGSEFHGATTDWEQFRQHIDNVEQLRVELGAPLPVGEAGYWASPSVDLAELRTALGTWEPIRRGLLSRFQGDDRTRIAVRLDQSFASARELLEELIAEAGQVHQLHGVDTARHALSSFGLSDVLVDLETRGVETADLGRALVQTVLGSWVQAIVSTDVRLRGHTGESLSQHADGFRSLDVEVARWERQVMAERTSMVRADEAARVGAAIADELQNDPRATTALLMRRAEPVLQALKPILVATPSAACALVPPSMRFDAVVVVEGQAMDTAWAIPLIGRANQLVVVAAPEESVSSNPAAPDDVLASYTTRTAHLPGVPLTPGYPELDHAGTHKPFDRLAAALSDAGWSVQRHVSIDYVVAPLVATKSTPSGQRRVAFLDDGLASPTVFCTRDQVSVPAAVVERSGYQSLRIWSAPWYFDGPGEVARVVNEAERSAGPSSDSTGTLGRVNLDR